MTTPEEANDKSRQVLTTFEKELQCKLHTEQVADLAQRLASIEDLLAEHRERTKSAVAELNAKKAALESERATLSRKVLTKNETRPVKVQWIADFDLNKAILERADTGEILESRALTDKERQTAMFRETHAEDGSKAKDIGQQLWKDATKPEPENTLKVVGDEAQETNPDNDDDGEHPDEGSDVDDAPNGGTDQ